MIVSERFVQLYFFEGSLVDFHFLDGVETNDKEILDLLGYNFFTPTIVCLDEIVQSLGGFINSDKINLVEKSWLFFEEYSEFLVAQMVEIDFSFKNSIHKRSHGFLPLFVSQSADAEEYFIGSLIVYCFIHELEYVGSSFGGKWEGVDWEEGEWADVKTGEGLLGESGEEVSDH